MIRTTIVIGYHKKQRSKILINKWRA